MADNFDVKSLKGITLDSRGVKKGYLFAALPGSRVNGCDYIANAIANGASAILMPEDVPFPEGVNQNGLVVIRDANPRKKLAQIAAEYYEKQPDYIAAVTGTNGKTSTVNFAEQLWSLLGKKAVSLGTLGLRGATENVSVRSGSMTTPDQVSLQAELADLAAVGVTHLAMEASSHGLDQFRLDGVCIKAAGFTNLSRDHLDYHGDLESYISAKIRLFSEVMVRGGVAILNADIPEFEDLKTICEEARHRVISYGFEGEDIKVLSADPSPTGQDLELSVMGQSFRLTMHLVGQFQLSNALCALGMVLSEDLKNAKLVKQTCPLLAELKGVPGRLELVSGHPKGAAVYVDYAHTPDAMLTVLEALRPHTTGRLICLFGCGGDRDKGKRPMMGEVASKHADHVIITDDNPRSEEPARIRKEIMAAAPAAENIEGRGKAIKQAVSILEDGDVLVVAGKGHEQGQVFDGYVQPFDDVEKVKEAIAILNSGT